MANGDLADQLNARRGLFGGAQEPRLSLDFNFADAGVGGMLGGIAPMLLQPAINAMFGGGGMMPAQFMPQQGLYDQWRAKQYWQSRQAATATASQADRETYVGMLRGMAQVKGTPWGLEQQRSANIMAGDMAYMAPVMAQAMPELFDTAHGTRGSATVMASYIHRAGRSGVDPATGRTGITGESAGALAGEMHKRFFGADANLADWRGMTAGRAGMLYDELQQRGLMGTAIGAMGRDEQRRALGETPTSREDALRTLRDQDPARFTALVGRAPGAAKLGGDDQIRAMSRAPGVGEDAIQGLQQAGGAQFDAILRSFDANRIGNRLKGMSGAVAAMREIFGDMGKPNAPMKELIDGLDQLTQGGMATMNPAQLERTVRTAQVVARSTGMGMQALQGLTAEGTKMAVSMGLDARFGAPGAAQAAQFGAAYGQVGRGDLGGWGRGSNEEMTLMDQQLRMRAAASPMADRLGAIMRISETMGKDLKGPLANVAQAVLEHRDTFTNERGQQETMNISMGRAMQLGEASNVSQGTMIAFLRGNNQEQINKYGTDEITRRRQTDEFQQVVANSFQQSMMGQVGRAGIEGDRGMDIAKAAAMAQSRALFDMPVEARVNDAARNQYMANATRTAVVAQLRQENPKLTEAQATAEFERIFPKADLNLAIAGGYGMAQKDERITAMGGLAKVVDVSNPQVMARQQFLNQETAAQVAMGSALAGLGTAGPLQRLMDEIQSPSADIGTAVKKVLGAVDPADIRKRLAGINPDDVARQAGTGAKDRLGVLMQEMLITTRQYEKDVAAPGVTDERRVALQEEQTRRIKALTEGGAAAQAQVKDELIKEKLIPAGANNAAVQEAIQQVMAGKRGSPDLQRRVQTLQQFAGGGVTPEAIRREQERILTESGVTDRAQIEKAIAGDTSVKISDDTRDRLRTVGALAGGITAAAEAANIATTAQVGSRELTDVMTQRKHMEADIERKLPAAGPEREAALAERQRHAEATVERGRRWVDVLLGDSASMRNLGKGGLAEATGVQAKQKEMADLARAAGLDLARVVGKIPMDPATMTPKKQEAMRKILTLDEDVKKGTGTLISMMNATDRKPMTREEVEGLTKVQADAKQTDEEKNKKLMGRITGLSADDQAALAQELGRGPESQERREAFGQMVGAREQLQEMAKRGGVDFKQLAVDVRTREGIGRLMGTGKLTGAEIVKAQQLATTAGGLGEGDGSDSVRSSLKQTTERVAAARADAAGTEKAKGGGKMAMSGYVTLRHDGTLDMSGAHGNMGSTPVG